MEDYQNYKSIDLKNLENMGVEPRYTTDTGLDIGDDFIDTLHDLDVRLGVKIAKFIADKVDTITPNSLVSHVIPGLVMDDYNEPVTFALEIIKLNNVSTMLSDLELVDMDEYLDLINLNKKTNGINQSKYS